MTIQSFKNIRRRWFQDETGHGTTLSYDAIAAEGSGLPSVYVSASSYELKRFDTPAGRRTFRIGETYLHTAEIDEEIDTRVVTIASIRSGSLALQYNVATDQGVQSKQYLYYPETDRALVYHP